MNTQKIICPPGRPAARALIKRLLLILLGCWFCLGVPAPAGAISDVIGPSPNHPDRTWKVMETEHFYVHYYPGYENFARLLARVVESGYFKISSDLGSHPKDKIPLIISEDEFWNGYAEPLRNRIVIDPRLSISSVIGLNRFVLHEMTHILTFEAVRTEAPLSNIMNTAGLPVWFSEGLAQYEAEYWAPENDRMLRLHTLNRSLLTPAERNVFVLLSDIGSEGYNEGYSIVKYWFETYGHDKVAKFFENYRSSNLSFNDAVDQTFGKNIHALEAEWRAMLEEKYRDQIAHRTPDIPEAEVLIPYKQRNTFFNPVYSPDGKWMAYLYTSGYPLIRGHLFSIMPLQIQKAEFKPAETEEGPVEGSPEEDEPVAPKDTQKLKVAERVIDFAWSPDGQSIAYTHLAAKANGNTTTNISIARLKAAKNDAVLEIDGEPLNILPGATVYSPSWSPDGRQVVLAMQEDERSRLVVYDVATKKLARTLYSAPDFRQFQNLRWSPDGQMILAEAFLPGEGSSLMLIDPANGQLRQLTQPVALYSDSQATWAPDSKTIYFVSTRTGFADLYRFDLATGLEERLSSIYSGLETPSISPDGKHVVYIRHHVKGTSLSQVAIDKLTSHETSTAAVEDPKFVTDSNLTPVPQKDYPVRGYKVDLAPDLLIPVTSRDEKGDQLGILMSFSDILQKHSVLLYLLYGLNSARFSYSLGYINHFFDPTFGIQFSDFPTLSFTTDGSQFFIERDQQVSFIVTRPFFNQGTGDSPLTRIRREATLNFSVIKQTNLRKELEAVEGFDKRQLREGFNNVLSFTWTENNANRPRTDGFGYSINLSGASRFWGSQYEFIEADADYRHYIPIFKSHGLALRGVAAALSGEVRPLLLGGAPLNSFLFLNFQDVLPLRGFNIAEFQGNVLLSSNVEYRFPVLSNLNWTLGGHYIDRVTGAVFVDVGDAWFTDKRTPFPNVAAGAELRLRAVLSNRSPFDLYLGVAKALVGREENLLQTRPLSIYGGFANFF